MDGDFGTRYAGHVGPKTKGRGKQRANEGTGIGLCHPKKFLSLKDRVRIDVVPDSMK